MFPVVARNSVDEPGFKNVFDADEPVATLTMGPELATAE